MKSLVQKQLQDKERTEETRYFICVSAQTEAEGSGGEWRHQTELEEAGGWKDLPQRRGGRARITSVASRKDLCVLNFKKRNLTK